MVEKSMIVTDIIKIKFKHEGYVIKINNGTHIVLKIEDAQYLNEYWGVQVFDKASHYSNWYKNNYDIYNLIGKTLLKCRYYDYDYHECLSVAGVELTFTDDTKIRIELFNVINSMFEYDYSCHKIFIGYNGTPRIKIYSKI